MTDYAQAERQLYDAFNELKYALSNPNLKQLFQDVKNNYLNEYINGYTLSNDTRKLSEKILNKLYFYLYNGCPITQVKHRLCVDFDKEYNFISSLTNPYIARYRQEVSPYKAYAAQKMLLAGIKKKKISEILDISNANLNILLKQIKGD